MSEINTWAIAVILVCALCTFLERVLPFLVFGGKNVPRIIDYLGRVLPMAIMTTLVFYCIRTVSFTSVQAYLPQLLASAVTVALHLWKRSTLLSIAGGTFTCMLLTQFL